MPLAVSARPARHLLCFSLSLLSEWMLLLFFVFGGGNAMWPERCLNRRINKATVCPSLIQ